jgi:pectate lyase
MRVARFQRLLIASLGTAITLAAFSASAQLPSFNGAEGFGGSFTGTTGGSFSTASVYHVNTTQDLFDGNGKPVQGTLRGAFYDYSGSTPKQQASNRIVVFDVGGTFNISSASLDIKTVSNIYVAGQTAPSPVTVYGNLSQITGTTTSSNIIMRYMTFRKGTGNGDDAITFKNGSSTSPNTNMIFDHLSATWSEDEVLSVANFNKNVTVQYSMMTDSLTDGHQYGSLIRPEVDSQVTFHHNLYGNDKSRNPRMGSYNNATLTLDFVDNIIYNWSFRAGYAGGGSDMNSPTEKVNVNWVGNYAIAGPATPLGLESTTAVTKDIAGSNPLQFKAYQALNLIDSNHNAIRDGTDTGWGMFRVSDGSPLPVTDQASVPFPTSPVTTTGAASAYNQVMNYVGNWWWNRDAIDSRIIGNVQNNTQPAGGIPALAPVPTELALVTGASSTSRAANWDSDNDGMPDWWESKHGLNPNSLADFKLDFDGDGYVNLQEYLDEIGAFPAPAPIVFNGATNGRYAVITNWRTSDGVTTGTAWQPSRFDEARITSGTVTVDAIGQHAGTLKVLGGTTPTLVISSGWLKVENDVLVGGFGVSGEIDLIGGTLRAKTINRLGGAFNFLGGKLSADTINFSLVNQGGTLAPGDSIGDTSTNTAPVNIGQTHVVGNLTLSAGSLQIELASLASFDKVLVDGLATLGGSLNISTLAGFTPANGNSWQIMSAGSFAGQFSSITPGYSVQQQGNNLVLFFGTPVLAGDYNNDGAVNAADYVVWRRAFGNGGTLANETASPGVVDQADYDAWRARFGASGSGAGASTSAVPEPATAVLFTFALGGLVSRRRL